MTDEIEVPDELRVALDAAPDAAKAFERLPVSHRREYADWVGEAKKPETRTRRATRAIEQIRAVARGL